MQSEYLVALVIFLSGLTIRAFYELLKKAGMIDAKSKLVFLPILLVMCLLWVSWFAMCPLDPVKMSLPFAVRWIGMGIFVFGLLLAFGALFQLKGVENIDHLETTGIFSRLRHPMYLGFICWIIGWAVYHRAGISLIAGLVGIANILFWRYNEEVDLVRAYGDAYVQYRKQTWF
jgi:protein-S-isoprenylcysteine O-methyltransferase Ste14